MVGGTCMIPDYVPVTIVCFHCQQCMGRQPAIRNLVVTVVSEAAYKSSLFAR